MLAIINCRIRPERRYYDAERDQLAVAKFLACCRTSGARHSS